MIHFLAFVFLVFAVCTFGQSTNNHYVFGPVWGYRRGSSNASILSIETTLIPGAPPKNPTPRLAIWPGIETPKGLAQPVVVSSNETIFNSYV
jgi:hypothetical protein